MQVVSTEEETNKVPSGENWHLLTRFTWPDNVKLGSLFLISKMTTYSVHWVVTMIFIALL